MVRTRSLCLVLAFGLAACSTELPHEGPFDPKSPDEKQARATLDARVALEGESDHAQITVEVQNGDRTYSVDTDAQGVAKLTGVVPGTYRLSMRTRYFEPATQTITVGIGEDVAVGPVTLRALRADVLGSALIERVEQDERVSSGGASLTLRKTGSIRSAAASSPRYAPAAADVTQAATVEMQTVSGDDGSYRFSDVPAGVYDLVAAGAGLPGVTISNVQVTGSGRVVLEPVVLSPVTGLFGVIGSRFDGAPDERFTATAQVNLELTGINAETMQIGSSSDGTAAGCVLDDPEPYQAEKIWSLGTDEGLKTVCVAYIGANGDRSRLLTKSIFYDATPPSPVVVMPLFNNGSVTRDYVLVNLAAVDPGSGVADIRLGGTSDLATAATLPFQPTLQVPLGSDGAYIRYLWVRDAAGNPSAMYTLAVTVDTQAPVPGSSPFLVNGGSAATSSTLVTLSFNVSGATRLMVSEDSAFDGTPWLSYAPAKSFLLSPGDGPKRLFARVADDAGNFLELAEQTITLDTKVPSSPYVDIQASVTSATTVQVNLGAAYVDEMMLSTAPYFSGATWEAVAPTRTVSFSGPDGTKVLYAKFRKTSGLETIPVSDSYVLDRTGPGYGSVVIHNGADYVASSNLALQLSAIDDTSGVQWMMLSESNDFSGAVPQAYQTGLVHPFTGGEGPRTIYVKFGDRAGNFGTAVSDSIIVDLNPPAVNFFRAEDSLGNPVTTINTTTIRLRLEAEDAVSPLQMRLSNNAGYTGAAWETYSPTRAWEVPAASDPAGENRLIYAQVRDAVGHVVDAGPLLVFVDTQGPTGVSISLADGEELTNDAAVSVALTATGASWAELSENAAFSNPVRFAMTGVTTYTFSGPDGIRTLYARIQDGAGNWSATVADTVQIDRIAPEAPQILINDGAQYSRTSTVTLSLAAIGAAEMSFSDDGVNFGAWEPFATQRGYPLPGTDGIKAVYVKYRDAARNEEDAVRDEIILDREAPTGGGIVVANGQGYTREQTVVLSLTATGASLMQVSEDNGFTGVSWEPFAAAKPFVLSNGQGPKTVYARFQDEAGWVTNFISDGITFDSIAPGNNSLAINGGSFATSSTAVTLTIGTNEPEAEMRISERSDFEGSGWEPHVSPRSFDLSVGDGAKAVYLQLRDPAGNESVALSQSIILDTQHPVGAIVVNQGAARTSASVVTLSLSASDGGSGLAGIRIANSEAALATTDVVAYEATKIWTLAEPTGPGLESQKTVWLQAVDQGGLVSTPVFDTITYDTLGPTGTVSIGVSRTKDTLVGVDLTYAADTTHMKISNGDSCAGGNWVEASPQTLWSIPSLEGESWISVRFRDGALNESANCYATAVTLDRTGPTPRIFTVRGNAEAKPGYSNTANLTIASSTLAADCDYAELSEDLGFIAPTGTVMGCTLSDFAYSLVNADDGFHDVYLRYFDTLGNAGPVTKATLVLDTSIPQTSIAGGFTILEGEWVNSTAITLQLSSSGATQAKVGEGGGCAFVPEAYTTTRSMTLSGGDGEKTISVQYANDAGSESACYARTVTLDTQVDPFTVSLQGHDGLTGTTASRAVTVTVLGVDLTDAVEMRVSNLASFTGASWEPIASSFDWYLPDGDGTKSVFMAVRDRARNEVVASGSIVLDQTPPNAPALQVIDVDGDGFALSANTVELSWGLVSGASRVELMRFVNGKDQNFGLLASLVPPQVTYVDSVTQPGFKHNYRARAIDAYGNASDWSIIASAQPNSPITTVTWTRRADGLTQYDFLVGTGTFSIVGEYQYDDVTGVTHTEQLLSNATSWVRTPPGARRFNEKLLFRVANQDNSLVQLSTVPLRLSERIAVESSSSHMPEFMSLGLDAVGGAHVAYHEYLSGGLVYGTDSGGAWETTYIEAGQVGKYASIAVDNTGKSHISYYDSTNGNLKYATNQSGGWVPTTVDNVVENVGQYTDIAVDASGIPHVSYYDVTNGDLKYATIESGVWVTTAVDATIADVGRYTSIALDSSGEPHISYYDVTNGGLKYAYRAAGTWSVSTLESGSLVGQHSSLVVDAQDKIHISYSVFGPRLRYGTNAGGGWSSVEVDGGNNGWYSSLGLDGEGHVHISYYTAAGADLKYATNAGGSFSVSTLDSAGSVGFFTSLAVSRYGDVHIAYQDSTNRYLKYVVLVESSLHSETVDGFSLSGRAGTYSSLSVDAEGRSHVSYYHEDAQDLKYAEGYPAGATQGWSIATIDSPGSVGQHTSLRLDAGGNPHISYYDTSNTSLKYARNVSGFWEIETVDDVGDVGEFSSMAFDSAGDVHIAYVDRTNLQVKYARQAGGLWQVETVASWWNNRPSLGIDANDVAHLSFYSASSLKYAQNSDGTWSVVTVDSNSGMYSSLALDAQGAVHISYRGNDGSQLKYATNQGGIWTVAVVDSLGFNGLYTSIVVDSRGAIHISYIESADDDLKYATNASGRWVTAILDSDSYVQADTALALDGEDRGYISYYDFLSKSLKVVHRFNGRLEASDVTLVSVF